MNDNYFFSSTDTSKAGLGMALFKEFDDNSLEDTLIQTDLSLKLRGRLWLYYEIS